MVISPIFATLSSLDEIKPLQTCDNTHRKPYNLAAASQEIFFALEYTEQFLAEDFPGSGKTDVGINRLGQEMPPC